MVKALTKKRLTPAEEMQEIQKALGKLTFEVKISEWLDTGSARLNSVLGSQTKGLAYGKMVELFGLESHGKTLLALLLASLAQADGAEVGWVDFENSLDRSWAEKHGVEWDKLYRFYPKLVQKDKKSDPELQNAEEVMDEVELWMKRRHKEGCRKLFLAVDSVAAMLVEKKLTWRRIQTANAHANSERGLSPAASLSRLLRKWAALTQVYGTCAVFINQIREAPGAWGNPERTPGGKALKFHCAIRVRVGRAKGGRLLQKGRDGRSERLCFRNPQEQSR